MNASLEVAIRDTVVDYVSSGIVFTAYDVTIKVRGDGLWAPHSDVRPIVISMWNGEMTKDYLQTMGNMSGTDIGVLVYHPIGKSVADHPGGMIVEENPSLGLAMYCSSPATIPNSIAPKKPRRSRGPNTTKRHNDGWHSVAGNDGVLTIPVMVTNKVFDIGQIAWAMFYKNSVTIVGSHSQCDSSYVHRTKHSKVDMNGNIKFGVKKLNLIGAEYVWEVVVPSVGQPMIIGRMIKSA